MKNYILDKDFNSINSFDYIFKEPNENLKYKSIKENTALMKTLPPISNTDFIVLDNYTYKV